MHFLAVVLDYVQECPYLLFDIRQSRQALVSATARLALEKVGAPHKKNWNELNFHNTHAYRKNKISIDTSTRQPVQSFELFNYCRNLCEDIDYVRLDFYLTEDDTVYFGEYTFTPTALNKYYTSDKIYDIMYNMYRTKNIDLSKIDELIK